MYHYYILSEALPKLRDVVPVIIFLLNLLYCLRGSYKLVEGVGLSKLPRKGIVRFHWLELGLVHQITGSWCWASGNCYCVAVFMNGMIQENDLVNRVYRSFKIFLNLYHQLWRFIFQHSILSFFFILLFMKIEIIITITYYFLSPFPVLVSLFLVPSFVVLISHYFSIACEYFSILQFFSLESLESCKTVLLELLSNSSFKSLYFYYSFLQLPSFCFILKLFSWFIFLLLPRLLLYSSNSCKPSDVILLEYCIFRNQIVSVMLLLILSSTNIFKS